MQTTPTQTRRLADYTNIPFEIFVAIFTIVPFLVLAYYYSILPARVPLFLELSGEVATWAEKSVLSVFRVPLMGVDLQLICCLMKYATFRSVPVEMEESEYVRLNVSLWDWFRCLVAVKLSAGSLDTIFLSLERFSFLARPAFIVTGIAALLSIAGALFYGYRLLAVKKKLGDTKIQKPVDAQCVYGGFLYFNSSDPAPFVSKYVFNFGNWLVYVLVASIVAYPLLALWPV